MASGKEKDIVGMNDKGKKKKAIEDKIAGVPPVSFLHLVSSSCCLVMISRKLRKLKVIRLNNNCTLRSTVSQAVWINFWPVWHWRQHSPAALVCPPWWFYSEDWPMRWLNKGPTWMNSAKESHPIRQQQYPRKLRKKHCVPSIKSNQSPIIPLHSKANQQPFLKKFRVSEWGWAFWGLWLLLCHTSLLDSLTSFPRIL